MMADQSTRIHWLDSVEMLVSIFAFLRFQVRSLNSRG